MKKYQPDKNPDYIFQKAAVPENGAAAFFYSTRKYRLLYNSLRNPILQREAQMATRPFASLLFFGRFFLHSLLRNRKYLEKQSYPLLWKWQPYIAGYRDFQSRSPHPKN